MNQLHRIDRHIVGATAAMAALFSGCGGGSDAAGRQIVGYSAGGSTLPGNEAIPDIGALPRGGATSTNSGNSAVGGTNVSSGGAPNATGGAISIGGAGTGIGGRDTLSNGGSGATGGSSLGGMNAGGQTTTGGRTSSSGAGGIMTNTGGAAARGGSVATGGATGIGGAAGIGGSAAYHTLADWVSPEASNKNHHGRMFFVANAQKDDKGLACNACHGNNFEGTASAPACASCHSNWRSCNFCHGTGAAQYNPPRGVFDESATSTLAVGRHAAHLTAGTSHVAFACNTCHTIPATNDVTHLLQYVPSNDLTAPGHHGDVIFSTVAKAMVWNVGATTGTPLSARGTCMGACHSNGRGGNPAKAPYWAGGTWTNGCTNCHGATGSTRNSEHGHGFPGSTCADCHTGATATSYAASTHMNGVRDIRTSPGGRAAGMTLAANWSCSSVPCH